MELLVEHLEAGLSDLIFLFKFVLEALAALIVFWGLIRTLQHAYKLKRRKRAHRPILENPAEFNEIRLTFGLWLALALEIQLAADILSTTIAPSFESLGKLAMIAVIRTFLNYFLSKELEAESTAVRESHDSSRAES